MARRFKKNAPEISHDDIEEQIEAFLKKGGEIEHVPSGKSGVEPVKGPRHLRISNK